MLSTALPRDEELSRAGESVLGKYQVQGIRDQAIAVQLQLSETSKNMASGQERQAIEAWSAHLAILLQRATNMYGFERQLNTPLRLLTADMSSELLSPHSPIRSPASPSQQISSPSFSITDSDGSECDSSVEDDQDFFSDGEIAKTANVFESQPVEATDKSVKRAPRPPSLELPRRASPTSSPRSPVENHSRNLTLEEGEVFRRGISKIGEDDERTLLDVLDGKEDIAGEELKQEILETEVERPRRLSISSEETAAANTS